MLPGFFYLYICCDYRLLDLVVHPVPQPSQCLGFIQQSPTRSPLSLASTSLPVNSQSKGSRHNSFRASELHLLETPLVVKVSINMSSIPSEARKFLLFK